MTTVALEVDRYLTSLEVTAQKTAHAAKAYRSPILLTCGGLACFCGQHFTYSALFWHSFSTTGWWQTKSLTSEIFLRLHGASKVVQRELPNGLPSVAEARGTAQNTLERLQVVHEAYQGAQQGDAKAAEKMSVELQALQEDFGLAQRLGSVAVDAVAFLPPTRLLEIGLGFRSIFFKSLSAALSRSADMIGVRANVGDTVARAVNGLARPRVERILDAVIARSGNELRLLREDPHAGRWIEGAISALCGSMGLAASFYAESLLLPFVNARLGAELVSHELCAMLARGGSSNEPHIVVRLGLDWLLCAGGLYFQFALGARGTGDLLGRLFFGRPELPGLVRAALFVPLVIETWLRAGIAARRLGLLDSFSDATLPGNGGDAIAVSLEEQQAAGWIVTEDGRDLRAVTDGPSGEPTEWSLA